MNKNITVVVIHSLSYTGTTWINCLLGCHSDAFALGPPDRVINLYHQEGWEDACRVHGKECSFWLDFYKHYNPKHNFYLQLAKASNKSHIIINNPVLVSKAEQELKHPDIIVKHIHVVRDGRAICKSYMGNNQGQDFITAIVWFSNFMQTIGFDEQDPDLLYIRHEDFAHDQFSMIKKCGNFIGLTYPNNFYKFWEFEHHMAAGNMSVYGMIRRFQQGKKFGGHKKDFYEREFERLQREPEKPILDEKWKTELGRRERFLFDYFCGEINESWGYQRDLFTTGEFKQFINELRQSENKHLLALAQQNSLEFSQPTIHEPPLSNWLSLMWIHFKNLRRHFQTGFSFSVKTLLAIFKDIKRILDKGGFPAKLVKTILAVSLVFYVTSVAVISLIVLWLFD